MRGGGAPARDQGREKKETPWFAFSLKKERRRKKGREPSPSSNCPVWGRKKITRFELWFGKKERKRDRKSFCQFPTYVSIRQEKEKGIGKRNEHGPEGGGKGDSWRPLLKKAVTQPVVRPPQGEGGKKGGEWEILIVPNMVERGPGGKKNKTAFLSFRPEERKKEKEGYRATPINCQNGEES